MPHGSFPSRRPPPAASTDPRHHHGSYSSRQDDLYRPGPDSCGAAPPPQRAAPPPGRAWSDGALSILSSCGLEPGDLSLLAELPEEALSVESLPHLLQQIKGRKATPPCSSSSFSSSCSSGERQRRGSQLVQYPLDHIPPRPLPPEQVPAWQDRRGHAHKCGNRTAPSSSSSSSSAGHRHSPSESGKNDRGVCLSQQPGPSASRYLRNEQQRGAPPPSRTAAAAAIPSRKEAQDFHGSAPTVFPYSCSLCNITVLSDKNWDKHVNGTHHADGQLGLLQRCPSWDCRLESVCRADVQSQTWGGAGPQPIKRTANQNAESQKEVQKKVSDKKSKVVCVKFPAQCVDEAHLRKLMEPFGKIVKILMFPSLAFVELGAIEQASDLVKFHSSCPPTINGQQIHFSISSTFNFLQSSQVVRFSPAPSGDDGNSDLLTIIKRFGVPLYTLFLPSQVFVEMEAAPDAAKLVDFYSSKPLRINDDIIKVTFSGEYRSLVQVPSAQRYQEEIRTRSLSRDQTVQSTWRRSNNRDSQEETRRRAGMRRSRSSERSSSSRDTKSRKRSRESRSRSRSRSSHRMSRSRERMSWSRSRSRSGDRRSRSESESRDRPNDGFTSRREKEAPQKAESRCDVAPLAASKPEAEQKQAGSSEEESDLEGMEVIGEDLEEEDDVETLQEAEEEEEALPDEGDREEVKQEVKEEQTEEEEGEPSFPVDLDDCVTLDELQEDEPDAEEVRGRTVERERRSCRVLYFRDLPPRLSEAHFLQQVESFGRAERFLLLSSRGEGFIEMCSSAEALRAAAALSRQRALSAAPLPFVQISNKYRRLVSGLPVASHRKDGTREEQSRSCRRSDGQSRSRTRDNYETEPSKRTSRKSPEDEDTPANRGAPEKLSESLDEDSESKDTPEKEPTAGSRPDFERTSASTRVPEEASAEPREEESAPTGALQEERAPPEEPESTKTSMKQPENQSESSEGERTVTGQEDGDARAEKPAVTPGVQTDAPQQDVVGPSGGASEPLKPVGAEFVRPVVGYFCHLCQLIYVDEDEAKVQHCSSRQHHAKYQEQTGKDPRLS